MVQSILCEHPEKWKEDKRVLLLDSFLHQETVQHLFEKNSVISIYQSVHVEAAVSFLRECFEEEQMLSLQPHSDLKSARNRKQPCSRAVLIRYQLCSMAMTPVELRHLGWKS